MLMRFLGAVVGAGVSAVSRPTVRVGAAALLAFAVVELSASQVEAQVEPPAPALPAQPSEEWTFCAAEGERCDIPGGVAEVRYGKDGIWTLARVLTQWVRCGNAVFGDVLFGVKKECQTRVASANDDSYPDSYFTGPSGEANLLPSGANGAYIGADPEGRFIEEIAERVALLEDGTGRKLDVIHIHYAAPRGSQPDDAPTNCYYTFDPRHVPFSEGRERWVTNRGSIPLVSWMPSFYADEILRGDADDCLRDIGQRAASFGDKFFLRMYWEMNEGWHVTSQLSTGGLASPEVHRAAWQRTVNVMRSAGATNAVWVWCPGSGHFNNDDPFDETLAYPGDAYVDWVCTDGYNWNSVDVWCGPYPYWTPTMKTRVEDSWCDPGWTIRGNRSPEQPNLYDVFGGRKPYMAGETGSSEDGDATPTPCRKAAWILELGIFIRDAAPNLEGFLYWDERVEGHADWRLDTSACALDAWHDVMRMPYFNTRG